MKVIIEQKAGEDYPLSLKQNEETYRKFLKELGNQVRKRLELREKDVVVIKEV